jgi:endonuclease III
MTTKTARKTRTRSKSRANEWNWEDFRPEWANEGIERITVELEKWNDQLQARSEKFRKESQKRIEKGVKQVQDELRKIPGVKRAEELRQELEERVEKNIDAGVDRVYTRLKLARLDEVKRLERKIAQLNKKLITLEKQMAA